MKVFESKPWYLWAILIVLTYGFMTIISSFDILFTLICVFIFCIILFRINKFEFFEDSFCKNYLFRPPGLRKKKCFSYDEIHIIEIRKIEEPYNRPYVILHFSPKKVDSLFFANRSFLFESIAQIEPLIIHIMKKEIPMKINISGKFQNEKIQLLKIIKDNGLSQNR